MGMIKEFKEFAMRGNVIDMAVGIIIGGAFGKIVTSLVSDVLMPPLGKIMGGADFSNLFITLSRGTVKFKSIAEAKAAGVATLNYGLFINTVIDFTIVAFAIFLMVKAINIARRQKDAKDAKASTPPEPPAEIKLLTEIRDVLKRQAD